MLQHYYNINKLKLNPSKTQLLIVNNRKNDHFKNFTFMAGTDSISPQTSIKILGTIIQNDLHLSREINKISSELHNRISNIRQITPFTNFKTRLMLLNSFVIGKLNYMVPMYSMANCIEMGKLQKIINTSARVAIGSYCFKKSVNYI